MSDASGTLWLDVGQRRWSEFMLAACGLDRSHMPRLVEGSAPSGVLRPSLARQWGLPNHVIVAGGGGDNAASAVGIGAAALVLTRRSSRLERQKKPAPFAGAGNRQGRNQLPFMNWGGTASGANLAAIVLCDDDGRRARTLAGTVAGVAGPLAGVLGWVGNVRHLGAFTGMLDVDEHRLAIRRFA